MRFAKALFRSAILFLPLAAAAGPSNEIAAAVAKSGRPAAMVVLDQQRRPKEVLRFLGIERRNHVLDVMAGSGYYSEIIGDVIGKRGSVIAQEPTFADAKVRSSLASLQQRVPNVKALYVMPGELVLPKDSIDFTIMHLVYHDTYWTNAEEGVPRMDPAIFLKRIFIATKPGGIVGVIDHVASPGGETRDVVDHLHRIDPATVRTDFIRAGFELVGASSILANPQDDHSKPSLDPTVRGNTDRFVFKFRKPL